MHVMQQQTSTANKFIFLNYRWSANQVIGEPKVYPGYGDRSGAWASRRTGGTEFLEVCALMHQCPMIDYTF